ncbi:hypothetical protein [Gemmatimonas sp.]|jgi:hypothetical protein|uniref:hypothetical protein n=1 Tax=Gemmatimonas sp. TaxID=1962908 RepID=UPI0037C063D5
MPMAPVLFRRLALACAVMLPVIAAPLRAQPVSLDSIRIDDPALVYAVTLTNATTLIGRITLVSADSVRVVSSAMTATVARREVRSVRAYPATALHDGVLWPENPHATRLLFAPTAIPLRRGEGYVADFWIFFASAATGITDRFTLGAGMSLFPLDNFTDNLFYALPKYTVISQPRLKVALGALMASVPWSSNDDGGRRRQSLGILYGVATTGSTESNLTLGAGWGYVGGTLANKPVITVGGQHRATKRIALISENWFIPFDNGGGGFVSYGVRMLGEKIAVDLALGSPVGADTFYFPGIPLLGFAFKF